MQSHKDIENMLAIVLRYIRTLLQVLREELPYFYDTDPAATIQVMNSLENHLNEFINFIKTFKETH